MRILIALILVGATAMPSWAKRCESADARKAVVEGKTQYDLGHYREAISLWEKVYLECPSPGLLFNLAQAHRMLGDKEEAITLYRSWLRESTDKDPEVRKEVEARVAELAALIAAQKKNAEQPPTGVDGSAPPPAAGAEAGGRVDVIPEPDAGSGDRGATDSPAWYQDWVGWSILTGGVVVVGVGAGLFVHGGTLHDRAESTVDQDEAIALSDSSTSYRFTGGTMIVVGGLLSIGGVVRLAITPRSESPRHRGTHVSVGPGWIGVAGSF
jgi:tetratricopeptide (TPR) repeat protein